MDASLKKILKAVTLELRHLLEGQYDSAGKWQPGDLEDRLAAIGVRRDRESVAVDELGHLPDEDKHARRFVDAYVQLREEAGVPRTEAVAEFVRETAYTWANRLVALRCMEARELIDEVILQKEVYGGRSLEHHRLAQREPEHCTGEDDGRFVMLLRVFARQAEHLPMLFDPQSPGVALRPSPAVLKQCIALLSGTETARSQDPASSEVFTAPDSLGWAYQYWNTEEKDRVFEKVRTQKGAKIEGADIVPATQLYTESYMVQFLVQNSLGATWMGMHPDSKLYEGWDYYVRDADRAPVKTKAVRELTFLDPACGSGHFLLEAFDLLYAMYEEEGALTESEAICDAILTQNLYGIDIDARSVQIAEVALWMKGAERAFDYEGVPTNLVAAVSSHLKGPNWDQFLAGFEKEPSVARVLRKFGESMEHIDELGSLARPNEDLKKIIAEEHAVWEQQVREQKEANYLFPEMRKDAVSGKLPFKEISDEEFGDRLFYRARAALDAFTEQAQERGDTQHYFLGLEASTGFRLLGMLGDKYDIVAANPPYLGAKKMGLTLSNTIDTYYTSGKQDLFAAFILSCERFTATTGRLALVTRSSWLTVRSYASLRCPTKSDNEDGVLTRQCLELLIDLGAGAFEEITGEVVTVALFVAQHLPPSDSHNLLSCDLTGAHGVSGKSMGLNRLATLRQSHENTYRRLQCEFARIPNGPVAYDLPEHLVALFEDGGILADEALCTDGANGRTFIIRHFWEVPTRSERWFPYCKGGGHQRWIGLETYAYDYAHNGARIKAYIDTRYPYLKGNHGFLLKHTEVYGQRGLTFTDFASGHLVVREIPPDGIPGHSGPAVYPVNDQFAAMAVYLNSRLATALLSVYTSVLHIMYSDVKVLPWRHNGFHRREADVSTVFRDAVEIGAAIASRDPIERRFNPSNILPNNEASFEALIARRLDEQLELWCAKSIVDGVADSLSCNTFDLDANSIRYLQRKIGLLLTELPDAFSQHRNSLLHLSDTTSAIADTCDRVVLQYDGSVEERLEHALRVIEGGNKEQSRANNGDDEQPMRFQVADNVFEEICIAARVHPSDALFLIRERLAQWPWAFTREKACFARDAISTVVLALLGHEWVIGNGSQAVIDGESDGDGIIPMMPGSSEVPLVERVEERLKALFKSNRAATLEEDFHTMLGRSLGAWLTLEFFPQHASQFQKRPLAWQLQSSTTTDRLRPAYVCLAYYHKLDGDLVRKIRKQAEDVLTSFATEFRGINTTSVASRSERQETRRVFLEGAIDELQKFDVTLSEIIRSGFGPDEMLDNLRQRAVADATLSLIARWLRRLSSLLVDTVLTEWQSAATTAEVHDDLSHWISEAVTHLNRHCATVGIKPPKIKDVGDEPTSADLAPLICSKSAEMLTGSLKCACDVWWKRFDNTVLGPLKEQVKEMKNERKEIKAKLESDPPPDPDDVTELTLRDRDLREDIKPIEKKIKRLKAKATVLRKDIEAWTSDEPLSWEPWLADQPLFDEVTSLDGHKAPPTTITEFISQESAYIPDINDGVRVNIAPLQKAGILAADVLAKKDIGKAIADRAEWRADERRWVREGKLPQPGWWPEEEQTT